MNILDHINNQFVSSIYASVNVERSNVGFFSIDNSGYLTIDLHLRDKPLKDIRKWGEWNKDYNVVVIKLILEGIQNLQCDNINDLTNLMMDDCFCEGQIFTLIFKGNNQILKIEYTSSTFQGCSKYLDAGE